MIYPISTLPLAARHRVSQITFHPLLPYLAVQSHDRSVEVFRIRNEEEVRKKQLRRKKREKEKQQISQDKIGGKKAEAEPQPETVGGEEEDINLIDLFTPYIVLRASGKIKSFDFSGGSDFKGGFQVRDALLDPLKNIQPLFRSSWLWPPTT